MFLESLNINVAPYATITNLEDIQHAATGIGFPSILKPVRVERNKPENIVLYSEQDFEKARELLQTGTCMLEAWIPFEKELAITVAMGSTEANITHFPVSHTIYKAGILQTTITPAQIDLEINEAIQQVAQTIARSLQMPGILTVELFITAAGAVYVKKIILYPHESCDYSVDACNVSQYELLVRSICGFPLPEITLWKSNKSYPVLEEGFEKALRDIQAHPEWLFHFYGEAAKEPERKVGHLTVLDEKEAELPKE
ncbi:ATP-grasp domain-containing protein [Jeotgalibaca sp. MA1X17-3]|uniref:ATP-grasp domain-containing protein n=1 Tax=Jeotgalibaca sp. MA1X17-3 TaxID=2908211 RepID=UPI002883023A|nr:ATP-grasp domain-containing protein [Jeotgalibaca sp. MA1X17-3]